ncbi:MAG: hypothetical protein JNL54_17130 [Kineosporiaceae bacterium]|nr:hypothetical protein [Kineosporiaceae bacterium]
MRLGRRLTVVAAAALVALLVPTNSALAAPAQFDEYYRHFDTGPKWQLYAHTAWVPQGLTKLNESTLIVSYYDAHELSNSIVALYDRATGNWLRTYRLDIKGHVGGIAMTSGYLWVTHGGALRRYPRAQLSKASGSTLTTSGNFTVEASSYAYAEGEKIWVGTWDPDARSWMYSYRVSASGDLTRTTEAAIYTPSAVQGVIVSGNTIVWSQSAGRDNDSHLIFWPKNVRYNGSTSTGNWVTAPNMSEGLVVAGGQIQVIYEACSSKYDGTMDGDEADYIVCSIHHGNFASTY